MSNSTESPAEGEQTAVKRSVNIMLRVTPAGAAYIDKERGALPRAEFVRNVLSEHAEAKRKARKR